MTVPDTDAVTVTVPDFCMVVLVGASGSGKSTFAARHFAPTEVVSSDACRALVDDDETSLDATDDAFALLQATLDLRLKRRRLTVVDATNVRGEDRSKLVEVARRHHALPVALVLDPGEATCRERNAGRPGRDFGPHVVARQTKALRKGMRNLKREGFRQVHVMESAGAVDAVTVARQRLWTDRRHETGPFDVVGDVHGCASELKDLLAKLGYDVSAGETDGEPRYTVTPPPGRKAVFVGDVVDRGPEVGDALRLVMDMVRDGVALCVMGNHEAKFEKWLTGRSVKVGDGMATSVADMEAATPAFRERSRAFVSGLVSHYLLDGGALAVAHAGVKEEMMGRASGAVRGFCLFGQVTGETDEAGLPVRGDWAKDYRGSAKVVYGHTPVGGPSWVNGTLCVDTGCVFGGSLTALRYPEMETVSVPARAVHVVPPRPFGNVVSDGQARSDDLLDLSDVTGKRIVSTGIAGRVTVREEEAAAALETFSRFAVDPRWAIYLPPTMSPPETSSLDGFLEHPLEAMAYYRRQGLDRVTLQEKHMGSRALLVVCRDAREAARRFGTDDGKLGTAYTRTGRPFFADPARETEVVARIRDALTACGIFDTLDSGWVILDAEVMPWSAKAAGLIEAQYAATATAARVGLSALSEALSRAVARGLPLQDLATDTLDRAGRARKLADVVRGYTWPVATTDDLRIAPFHLLASEGHVHSDRLHDWHLEHGAAMSAVDKLFEPTASMTVDLSDPGQVDDAVRWWTELTAKGREGVVVKPVTFVTRGRKGLVQPAVKCRGPEYLRMIYGPDYDTPENLARLRHRRLASKRSAAIREFALGLEGLSRFVAKEPLRRVHECAFGVMALETDPVDPRL